MLVCTRSYGFDVYLHTKIQFRPSLFFMRFYTRTNPLILLTEGIFAHISGTRFFPDIGFMQERRQ